MYKWEKDKKKLIEAQFNENKNYFSSDFFLRLNNVAIRCFWSFSTKNFHFYAFISYNVERITYLQFDNYYPKDTNFASHICAIRIQLKTEHKNNFSLYFAWKQPNNVQSHCFFRVIREEYSHENILSLTLSIKILKILTTFLIQTHIFQIRFLNTNQVFKLEN